jgi:hypothetical protein
MDITTGFEPVVGGSNPSRGIGKTLKNLGKKEKIVYF